jgi:hypothetical protein
MAVLAWGFILIAVSIFVFEFIISDYEVPAVSLLKWGGIAAAAILIFFTRDKDEVIYHHLPH